MEADNTVIQDCDIVVRKELKNCLFHYAKRSKSRRQALNIGEIKSDFNLDSPEMHQLYISPYDRLRRRERCAKMLPCTLATSNTVECAKPESPRPVIKRGIDTLVQTSQESYTYIPRTVALARIRQEIVTRNGGMQYMDIQLKNAKTQTDQPETHNISVNVIPQDFVDFKSQGSGQPLWGRPGLTKEQGTQMYDHITKSDLFCIEWIHKNMFAVRMSPNTLVVGDRLKDHSEKACVSFI